MPHQTPELCANPECHHGRSLHVANRMNCCVVSCSCNHYVEEEVDYNGQAPALALVDDAPMLEDRMEPYKPFLPGVEVYTEWGKGVVDDILLIDDAYCPYVVNMSDGKKRTFKRENLSLNPANAPKALHCICDSKPGQAHHFECPLSLSEPVKSQSEILHQEPVRFVSLSAVNIRLLALDRDGQLWASLYSGLPDKLKWYRCNMPVKD